MEFKNTNVYNFEGAFRGMRNPLNSWDKSDSFFGIIDDFDDSLIDVAEKWVQYKYPNLNWPEVWSHQGSAAEERFATELLARGTLKESSPKSVFATEAAYIGPKDMKLAQNLIRAGDSDAKFLRQIFVSVDITAPVYFLNELDTYKVATTRNSTSLQHKGMSRDYNRSDFSIDNIQLNFNENNRNIDSVKDLQEVIDIINKYRQLYKETKDYTYFRIMRQLMPMGYNYTITWSSNYAGLRNIYFQRRKHQLKEWRVNFIEWIKTLPYSAELITLENN